MQFSVSLCLCLMLAAVLAEPHNDLVDDQSPKSLVRLPRFTCNVLAFTGNAACNAHCKVLERNGGECQDGICHCY